MECIAMKYDDAILFHWKGNLSSNSITMKVFPHQNVITQFRIISWDNQNYYNYQQMNISSTIDYPIIIQWDGLMPDTQYFYFFDFLDVENITTNLQQIYDNGKNYEFTAIQDRPLFSFKTIGIMGQPYSFNFSMSGCARSGSVSTIFVDIYKNTHPLFFFMLGDLHYRDIKTNSSSEFLFAYNQIFGSLTQRYLYQQVPFEYQFDDHDYGINDADGTSPTRQIANYYYDLYVPHSNLHNYMPLFSKEEASIYPEEINQVETITEDNIGSYRYQIIGRTAIITMDLRTFQALEAPFSMLGAKQREWLLAIFNKIIETDWIKTVLLISSVNFHGDIWESFPSDQLRVAEKLQYLQEVSKKQVLIISSDSHMTAMKNGQDSFIQNLGEKYKYGLQETMCGSLDKPGSCKTIPLTFGPWLGKDHYTNVLVQDTNFSTCIIIRGYEKTEELFYYNTCDDLLRQLPGKIKCPFDVLMRAVYVFASLFGAFAFLTIIYFLVKRCHKESMKYSLVMREK